MNPLEVSNNNIWQYRQNKPHYIADDLYNLHGVPKIDTMKVLLARGVFKWFAVRRELVKLKNKWRDDVSEQYKLQTEMPTAYRRGYIKAMETCRKDVRKLCHSERWAAPDFDTQAIRFLEGLK